MAFKLLNVMNIKCEREIMLIPCAAFLMSCLQNENYSNYLGVLKNIYSFSTRSGIKS